MLALAAEALLVIAVMVVMAAPNVDLPHQRDLVAVVAVVLPIKRLVIQQALMDLVAAV
jgi:hypothetical protein